MRTLSLWPNHLLEVYSLILSYWWLGSVSNLNTIFRLDLDIWIGREANSYSNCCSRKDSYVETEGLFLLLIFKSAFQSLNLLLPTVFCMLRLRVWVNLFYISPWVSHMHPVWGTKGYIRTIIWLIDMYFVRGTVLL